eukprot:14812542-Ditylum_brightwellii.AAC.1
MRLRELKLFHNGQGRQCFNGYFGCDASITWYDGGDLCCNVNNSERFCSDEAGIEMKDLNICLNPALRRTIPAEFGNTPYMENVEMSYNLLTGNIPPEIGVLLCFKILDLANNSLTGSISSALGSLVNAAVLVQGNDMITGQNKDDKIALPSLCSNVCGFDVSNDPTRCPPECKMLRKFYDEAKGKEWANSTGWTDMFNNHCDWYGVECTRKGEVVSLMLGNY